ncbi:MAG TPA: hypothetical protein O0X39_07300 [Methanocorpusculum sp.]|nr:hypothetical protein [Methanocorpusculum sp.]
MPEKTSSKKDDGFWTRLVWRLAMTKKSHALILLAASLLFCAGAAVLYKAALISMNAGTALVSGIALIIGVIALVTSVMMLFMQKIKNDIRKELTAGKKN